MGLILSAVEEPLAGSAQALTGGRSVLANLFFNVLLILYLCLMSTCIRNCFLCVDIYWHKHFAVEKSRTIL